MFKKMLTKTKSVCSKVKSWSLAAKATVTGAIMSVMASVPVFATEVLKPADNLDAGNIIGKAASVLLGLLQGLGLIIIIWGGYNFAMSIQQDNPDARTKGIQAILAGAVCVGLKALLKALGVIA